MAWKQVGARGYNILPLDGQGDYLLWDKQMKGKLRSINLANVLRDKPMHITDIDRKDSQEQAVYIVMGYLDPSVMKQIEEYSESMEEELSDIKKAMHLFHSLPSSYPTLSKILLHRDNKAVTYNEVISALLADEVEQEMLSFSCPLTSSIALIVTRGKSQPCGKTGHIKKDYRMIVRDANLSQVANVAEHLHSEKEDVFAKGL
ncbi:hypothetical protein AXG93_1467s1020 [Marchantia polymorpha subsp. ruderalis]|uniref:Uncharacterized protein n=1 Tax=Marchantia polymorpha subsp. ruderalis TaxID=1480154 RepID=A0A176WJV8_MARPO|nr:hypothetical protein AXG93_1467s1020 [Marchantia polymorpha subsp. ruderalis]